MLSAFLCICGKLTNIFYDMVHHFEIYWQCTKDEFLLLSLFCESFYIADAFNGISYTERIAFKYPIKPMHFRVPVLYKCNIDSYGEHHLVQIPIRINVFHQIEWPNLNHQKIQRYIYIFHIKESFYKYY